MTDEPNEREKFFNVDRDAEKLQMSISQDVTNARQLIATLQQTADGQAGPEQLAAEQGVVDLRLALYLLGEAAFSAQQVREMLAVEFERFEAREKP